MSLLISQRHLTCIILKTILVNDESLKFTKKKILEAAQEYGLTPYLQKCAVVSDGALLSVAAKHDALENDIEFAIKIRCACHSLNRMVEVLYTSGLKNVDKN